MSYTPEPAIKSRDTGQRTPCVDSAQLTITWMPIFKEVRIYLFLKLATPYVRAAPASHAASHSMDFLWVWGSALRPLGLLWSSATKSAILDCKLPTGASKTKRSQAYMAVWSSFVLEAVKCFWDPAWWILHHWPVFTKDPLWRKRLI